VLAFWINVLFFVFCLVFSFFGSLIFIFSQSIVFNPPIPKTSSNQQSSVFRGKKKKFCSKKIGEGFYFYLFLY